MPTSQSEEQQPEGGEAPSGITALIDRWDSDREPFDEWVQDVSEAFFETSLGLEDAALWLQSRPAELAAVLRLATLDEDELTLLAEDVPPKTTWFAFSRSDSDGIEAGLDALANLEDGRSAHWAVEESIEEVSGPRPVDRVVEVETDTLVHFAEKAEQYNALWEKGRKALRDIAKKKQWNDLTEPQKVYLHDLVEQLADQGVISRDSPDDDQALCDEVLDALGR